MRYNMEYKESLKAINDNLVAEIYKLNNCDVYWIRFIECLDKEKNFVAVRVLAEFTDYNYRAIKEHIKNKLFYEISKELEHPRRLKKAISKI